jgi:MFS family permease
MRPGILFLVIFIWLVCNGGRFTATFLEDVAQFNESLIGLTFALQILFGSVFAGFGSIKADQLEMSHPRKGRLLFLIVSIVLGTIGFMLHFVIYYYFNRNQYQQNYGIDERGEGEEDDIVAVHDFESSHGAIIGHIIARIINSVFSALLFPIVDGISLTYLKESHSNAKDYGKERLFGAIGWAVASVLIGPCIDKFGFLHVFIWSSPASCILCVCVIMMYMNNPISFATLETLETETISTVTETQAEKVEALMMDQYGDIGMDNIDIGTEGNIKFVTPTELEMCNLTASCELTNARMEEKEEEELEQVSPSSITNVSKQRQSMMILKSMFQNYAGIGFIISFITLNMGVSVVENLIFLFFEKLGGSNSVCGASVVVTVIFEIPIFQYSSKLLDMYGAEALQKVACFAYVIRVVGYTFIPQDHAVLVLLLEPLHGLTYACAKTASVEFASKLTPTGYESTGMGIISVLGCIGTIIGLSMGGWIEDTYSAVILYRSYALIVAFGLVIFYVSTLIETRRQRKTNYSSLPKGNSVITVDDALNTNA